jgi:hypothetical protein
MSSGYGMRSTDGPTRFFPCAHAILPVRTCDSSRRPCGSSGGPTPLFHESPAVLAWQAVVLPVREGVSASRALRFPHGRPDARARGLTAAGWTRGFFARGRPSSEWIPCAADSEQFHRPIARTSLRRTDDRRLCSSGTARHRSRTWRRRARPGRCRSGSNPRRALARTGLA